MINVKNGVVEAEGMRIDLMKEFSLIIQAFVEKDIIKKDCMHEMVEMFGRSNKEIIKQALIDEIDKMENIGDGLYLLGKVLSDDRLN